MLQKTLRLQGAIHIANLVELYKNDKDMSNSTKAQPDLTSKIQTLNSVRRPPASSSSEIIIIQNHQHGLKPQSSRRIFFS